jgi:hypothetical protein
LSTWLDWETPGIVVKLTSGHFCEGISRDDCLCRTETEGEKTAWIGKAPSNRLGVRVEPAEAGKVPNPAMLPLWLSASWLPWGNQSHPPPSYSTSPQTRNSRSSSSGLNPPKPQAKINFPHLHYFSQVFCHSDKKSD